MTARRVFLAAMIIVLSFPAWAQSPSRQSTVPADAADLMQAATRDWAWHGFWLPNDPALLSYKPGRTVDILAAESGDLAGYCSTDLRVCVAFQLVAPGKWASLGHEVLSKENQTKADVLRALEAVLTRIGDLRFVRPQPPSSSDRRFDPSKMPAPVGDEGHLRKFAEQEFSYVLPPLGGAASEVPTDVQELRAAVIRQSRRSYPKKTCQMGSATVPRYSLEDPWIYVFLEFRNCGEAILILKFVPGYGWDFVKLATDRGDVAALSELIRERQLSTFRID